MRLKQEPVFSVLEEMDLDISFREKEKGDVPPEEIQRVTQLEIRPDAQAVFKPEPAGDIPSAVIVAAPIFDLPGATEIRSASVEKEKGDVPPEEIQRVTQPEIKLETQSEIKSDAQAVFKLEPSGDIPSAVIAAAPIFDLPRATEICSASREKEKISLPSEEIQVETRRETEPEILLESVGVRQLAVISTKQLPDMSRATGTRLCDVPFVYIAPGSFLMGSPEHEPGRGSDETQHEVTLTRGYSIQMTPVTQGQWKALMGSNPSNFPQGGENCPVEGVNWNDCQEFIKRINKMGEFAYRLPTEAEWEYACRAGASTSFFNGEISSKLFSRRDPCLDEIGWYSGNSGKKTHPVAEKKPNAWGLFDMNGNVCEWCQDWYGKYVAKPQIDPRGVLLGIGCVVRGGSWSSNSQNCRSASRFYCPPNSRRNFVGFRLVRDQGD
jgi:formylglycine-generating enzyme required for sulfatase activity